MSAKRVAGRELNHDNWNEEDESEEAGEFKKASDEALKNRVIKVAKRRMPTEGEKKSNPFTGFGGFSSSGGASTPPSSSPFSFLAKLPSASEAPKTNGSTGIKSDSSKSDGGSNDEYYSKVKALNLAFVDWIKSNVDITPLIDLTPTFKDYEKHLKECEEFKGKKIESKEVEKLTPTSTFSFGKPAAPSAAITPTPPSSTPSVFNNFKFGAGSTTDIKQSSSASQPEIKTTFSFAPATVSAGTSASAIGASASFSFGLPKSNAAPTPSVFGSMSSNAAQGFTFSNVAPPAEKTEEQKDDVDEEPPKNEFVPVVEDDSLYSKRCKVYVKTSKDYSDRGVGTLYLKKAENSKVQLIVRADTNLGNILLNVLLSDGLPVSRLGKNNVMVVCIPTPDSKPPPTSVLLRVKTSDEADELLETINKHKK